ncbi:MAG: hypothetical protein ACPGUI_00445 [Halarcobacter sp.]
MSYKKEEEIINDDVKLWIGHNLDGTFALEYYKKTKDGILYGVSNQLAKKPDMEFVMNDQHNHFSQRPFLLGQNCDGSGDTCGMSLFANFCESKDLNPTDVFNQAYERKDTINWEDTHYRAAWEGVKYPLEWNDNAITGLLYSLYAMNYRSLCVKIEEILEVDFPYYDFDKKIKIDMHSAYK